MFNILLQPEAKVMVGQDGFEADCISEGEYVMESGELKKEKKKKSQTGQRVFHCGVALPSVLHHAALSVRSTKTFQSVSSHMCVASLHVAFIHG